MYDVAAHRTMNPGEEATSLFTLGTSGCSSLLQTLTTTRTQGLPSGTSYSTVDYQGLPRVYKQRNTFPFQRPRPTPSAFTSTPFLHPIPSQPFFFPSSLPASSFLSILHQSTGTRVFVVSHSLYLTYLYSIDLFVPSLAKSYRLERSIFVINH